MQIFALSYKKLKSKNTNNTNPNLYSSSLLPGNDAIGERLI